MTLMRNLILLACISLTLATLAAPLQTFTLKDYLNRGWVDELVHFPFDVAAADELHLTDADNTPLPCQFTDLVREKGRVKGYVWTVVTLKANATLSFHLQAGAPKTMSEPGVALAKTDAGYLLRNDRVGIRLPLWSTVKTPCALDKFPGPHAGLMNDDADGLSTSEWANTATMTVKSAATTVLEDGPLRAVVRQAFTLEDGRAYAVTFSLAAKQDLILVTEDSTIESDKAVLRLNMRAGLDANLVQWYDSYYENVNAGKNRTLNKLEFDMGERERELFRLSPWSFWWNKDRAQYCGFTDDMGGAWMVSLQLLRPSRWLPYGWDGLPRLEFPVRVAGDRLDVLLPLAAYTRKHEDGKTSFTPLHREWALSLDPAETLLPAQEVHPYRKRLIQYSEFPLDEVKDYRFDFTPARPERKSPFLFFDAAEFTRTRAQAKDNLIVRAEALRTQVAGLEEIQRGGLDNYFMHFWGQGGAVNVPTAYMAIDDPRVEKALVAGVLGLKQEVLNTFLNRPPRPSLGGYGPWFTDSATSLVKLYDLIAGRGLLTPEEDASVHASLVFLAHQLYHPDYWNTDKGLCSANPNMTSSIKLPQALLGLYLEGHPEADKWLKAGEEELVGEIREWVSPGGAWVESPGYQSASMDGMFMLATAMKQVKGRDYFAEPRFKELMDYYGYLLTPPDVRFPTPARKKEFTRTPMVLPSVGDTFAGFITGYNGWMAKTTAKSDPAYSARQQFFWQCQDHYYGGAGRATGLMLALTDPALPATVPEELSKSFPGFGNVMRTSWTDPKASYLSHRTGPHYHHYHADYGSVVYYAKGAPLCTDFGNLYMPARRDESHYHSLVHFGVNNVGSGEVTDFATLRRTVDYSYGKTHIGGDIFSHRHILFLKSTDPMGANYVVMRDAQPGLKPDQPVTWSLWCLATPWEDPNAPKVDEDELLGNLDDPPAALPNDLIHFTGQFGVDLDVHILSPKKPVIERLKNWDWTQHIYVWGPFKEAQSAGRITKQGSAEDFITVLYPRAKGQDAAVTTAIANGAGAAVKHMEGADYLLRSPGKPTAFVEKDVRLNGEIVFARKYANGTLRLALLRGKSTAELSGWKLASTGTVAVEITGKTVTGETDGPTQTVTLTPALPYGPPIATLDGKPLAVKRENGVNTFTIPEGYHAFTLNF